MNVKLLPHSVASSRKRATVALFMALLVVGRLDQQVLAVDDLGLVDLRGPVLGGYGLQGDRDNGLIHSESGTNCIGDHRNERCALLRTDVNREIFDIDVRHGCLLQASRRRSTAASSSTPGSLSML